MKIAILVNDINVMGGTHKQFLRFAQYLRSQKIDFEVITKYLELDKTYSEFSEFDIKFIKNKKNKKNKISSTIYDFYVQIKIFFLLDKYSLLINVHDNGFPLTIFLSKLFRKKVYWQLNDLPWVFNEGASKDVKVDFLRSLYAIVSRCFYRFIISRCIRRITVNVSKNRTRVLKNLDCDADLLYCGVDPWSGLNVERSGLGQEIKILSSGVFYQYRNYETQIELVKKLKESGYIVRLDIIGSVELDRQYATKIYDLIELEGLTDCIFIHGQVSQEKYHQLHQEANVFIFINIDQSWGLAVFEAMSAGLPVIVSSSVGATEILTNNFNSLFVDPYSVDEIISKIQLISNDDTYQKISNAAKDFVQTFTWDKSYSSRLLEFMKRDDS